MDDLTRQDLLDKLAAATAKETDLTQRLTAHGENIAAVRQALGNPYFYGGRPDSDPESEAHFTGGKSHEPALTIWQEWQAVSREIETINRTLQAG